MADDPMDGALKLKLFTYYQEDKHALITKPTNLESHCPLDNGRHEVAISTTADCSIGTLCGLPTELVYGVFEQLDLRSLTCLRSTSQGFRLLVDAMPQYNDIFTHAPVLLRAMLSTTIASYYTVPQLHHVLCDPRCSLCHDYGAYFLLVSCTRRCVTCCPMATTLPMHDVNLIELVKDYRSTARHRLPVEVFPSGGYEKERKGLLKLIKQQNTTKRLSVNRAQQILEKNEEMTLRYLSNEFERMHNMCLRARALGEGIVNFNLKTYNSANPIGVSKNLAWIRQSYRFIAVIRLPYLNRNTGVAEWGYSCKGCRVGRRDDELINENLYQAERRAYTANDCLLHFEVCQPSQEIWDAVVEARQAAKPLADRIETLTIQENADNLPRWTFADH